MTGWWPSVDCRRSVGGKRGGLTVANFGCHTNFGVSFSPWHLQVFLMQTWFKSIAIGFCYQWVTDTHCFSPFSVGKPGGRVFLLSLGAWGIDKTCARGVWMLWRSLFVVDIEGFCAHCWGLRVHHAACRPRRSLAVLLKIVQTTKSFLETKRSSGKKARYSMDTQIYLWILHTIRNCEGFSSIKLEDSKWFPSATCTWTEFAVDETNKTKYSQNQWSLQNVLTDFSQFDFHCVRPLNNENDCGLQQLSPGWLHRRLALSRELLCKRRVVIDIWVMYNYVSWWKFQPHIVCNIVCASYGNWVFVLHAGVGW